MATTYSTSASVTKSPSVYRSGLSTLMRKPSTAKGFFRVGTELEFTGTTFSEQGAPAASESGPTQETGPVGPAAHATANPISSKPAATSKPAPFTPPPLPKTNAKTPPDFTETLKQAAPWIFGGGAVITLAFAGWYAFKKKR
jgi:hypothetical protein